MLEEEEAGSRTLWETAWRGCQGQRESGPGQCPAMAGPGQRAPPVESNEHFHGWILRNLPARRRAAVDVGCGPGVLAEKLAPHFARVTGIDADAGMAGAASARLAHDPGVTIRHCRFEQFAVAAGHSEADLITMVAVLHHLDLEDTLARIPGLLAPGGRLLVVGLARVSSLPDLAAGLISAAVNPVMGLIRHPRPARQAEGPAAGQPVMPVRDPATTLAEITAAARASLRALPSGGACSSATPCAGTSHRYRAAARLRHLAAR